MSFVKIAGLALIFWLSAMAFAQHQPMSTAEARQQRLARERWQAQGRRVPGQNSAALRLRALQQKEQMLKAQASNALSNAGWSLLGPLPLPSDASGVGIQDYSWVTGRATAVAVDPNDSSGNIVFIGGAYGGVWKSTNAGAASTNPASVTWTSLTDDQPTLAIGSIAVQPQLSNPNPTTSIVLAGTGETDSSADSYYGLGILRSTDGGQTWALISQDAGGTHPFAGLGFSKIAFSTANPNVVVAAAASATEGIIEGLENPIGINRGIYYSTDAGLTWNAANIADASTGISPSSITSVVYNTASAKFYAAITFHGFYSSSDGVKWARLPSQPGSALLPPACPAQTTLPSACPLYRGEIAIVPNRSGPSGKGEMYVWFVDANDGDQGIWKSLDGGASWLQINESGITNCGDALGGCGTEQGTFNLALAAVPDGTATDLYAGAVNLYKCTITDLFPTCNGTGDLSFLNLTHVYGCSDIAKVHPGQHGIAFPPPSSTALLYFANDGGIYRALDGYLGLRGGTCGQANQFDSLNATLGPLTQFVSLAQSASDPNLIFGGTQDNGAPATAFAQSGGPWVNVNAGDTGYTATNPSNENEWLASTPPDSVSGVNLFSCSNGVNCHTIDFENGQLADSDQLGGDTGPFYLPFIFDPANPGSLLLGTCRIWRGPSSGGAFSLLSPDFETGGTGACTGEEVNLVRSITAGGAADQSSFSQAIYVGTNGDEPSIPTTPSGGHVWVTRNADAGPTSWIDRTGAINPNNFSISGVALDPLDPSGQAAYVTVMGFHTPHVWQTNDAGIDWNDFTGNLPDAPVNSIVIDPGVSGAPSTIYVGTDVGVFSSSTAAPNWTAVDPAQGLSGALPNVAVTALQIFNSGGLKRLRAATYGRGLWEWNLITTPDFQLSITNNPQTVFAGSSATFNGTVSSINGYDSTVNLSCAAANTPAPQTCSPAPASIAPSPAGNAFTLTAADIAGDYSFNLQGVGTDPASVTHNFALTLHVIDFNLSTPSPDMISVVPGATTAPLSITVSAAGAFNLPVTLTCSGLPQGATCGFQPSSTVTPTSSNPAAISLSISTGSTTPLGSAQVTISATTADGPTKTQTVSLLVSGAPDYSLAVSNSSLTTHVNATAVFQGTLTAINGYNGMVALSCGTGAPPSCSANPPAVTPTASGGPFTVTASSGVSQAYTFTINAVGSDPAAITHSIAVSLSVLPNQSFDFSMGVNPPSASVPDGQATTYTVDVNPSTGGFPSNVSLTCSNLPQLTTCTFNPKQVGAGSGNSTVALSVATTAPTAAPRSSSRSMAILVAFTVAGFLWIGVHPRKIRSRFVAFTIAALVLACASCGGGLQGNGSVGGGGTGNPGTPKGTYNITVTATCGQVTHNAQASLTVD